MNASCSKAFVLGLDGGSWNILTPFMNQGYMPNLKKIHENGVSGTLQSTQPPYTGPAWVSSFTGVNPGKHGVFGFTNFMEGKTQRSLISSRTIGAKKIWRYLDKAGKSSGLINVPVTYPVESLNGFMISGFLAPQGAEDFTYPADLYKDLIKEVGTYIVNVRISGRMLDTEDKAHDFIKDIMFCTQKRFEAMKTLWSSYAPDFFMIVFNCLDKIQHKFWKFLDIEEPLYHTAMAEKLRPRLIEVYQQIDKIIGYILKRLNKNTTLLIISDHGFGPLEKRVFINKWLKQEKLLSFKKHKAYIHKFVNLTKLNGIKFSKFGIGIASDNPVDSMIDFSKTLFYSSDAYEQGIYFNSRAEKVQRRQVSYEDEIKKTEDKIRGLTDPQTGECFVDEVRRREDIYWGPYIKQAPNLLLKMKNYGYLLNKSVPLKGDGILREVSGPDGCHRSEGIFAAYGFNIDRKKNFEASIMDVTPTVLYNLGVAVPEGLDGKVLKNIFAAKFKNITKLEFSKEEFSLKKRGMGEIKYNEKEEKEIRSRLKELGYLD